MNDRFPYFPKKVSLDRDQQFYLYMFAWAAQKVDEYLCKDKTYPGLQIGENTIRRLAFGASSVPIPQGASDGFRSAFGL